MIRAVGLRPALLFALCLVLASASWAEAKCAPGLVRVFEPGRLRAVRVTYPLPRQKSRRISLEWFGHAYFQLISPGGIRVAMDPFSFDRGYPVPKVRPHAVTIGKETMNHRAVEVLRGKPLVLRGLKHGGVEWARIDRRVGDVHIRSVPIMQGVGGYDTDVLTAFGRGATFVFETGGLCVAHLGDLAGPMTRGQMRQLGRVHVALVVLSERVSMGPRRAAAFIRRLGPNVAIPMHFYDNVAALRAFLAGFRRVRKMAGRRVFLEPGRLPPPTEVVVLRHP